MSQNNRYLFTSESVSMGHPDKMADQISDGILDAIFAQDPHAHVACETLLTTGLVVGQMTLPVLSVIGPLCLVALVAPHLRLPGGPAAITTALTATLVGSATSLPKEALPLLAMAAATVAGLATDRRTSRP